jgi:Tfp pilus assembly protein FimT
MPRGQLRARILTLLRRAHRIAACVRRARTATRSSNSTRLPQASMPDRESRWAGKRPQNSSSQKEPSTSKNTGRHQTQSTVLHVEYESAIALVSPDCG